MRTVVLGAGRMGRRHIQAARLAGCEVVGVYDIAPASLDLARTEAEVAPEHLFTDLEAVFATNPECVIIATTADSHADLTCQAAERGARFVFVEKPMAVSLEECDRMMEVCQRHGTQLGVNHQMRFMEQYTKPKALFAGEAFGGLASMTVVSGNFGLAMNGTHYFEAFRFLTDDDVAEVSAWFSNDVVPNPRGPQFEDRAGSVRLVTKGGKRFYLETGSDQGHGVFAVYACRQGFITINELTGEMVATARQEEYRVLPTTRYGMPAETRHETIQGAEVIDSSAATLRALLTGEQNVSAEHGRSAVEVLVAAHLSAEQGGAAVRLPVTQDRARVFPWA